jgi:hypothetical protein
MPLDQALAGRPGALGPVADAVEVFAVSWMKKRRCGGVMRKFQPIALKFVAFGAHMLLTPTKPKQKLLSLLFFHSLDYRDEFRQCFR